MATSLPSARIALAMVAASKQLTAVQVYTEQEAKLFRKFLPYSFENGKLFNPSDRNALLDANQRIFNIVAKIDHTHANMLCRINSDISGSFRDKAKPVATAMETLSGYKLPENGKLDIYRLKMGLLESLSATIKLLMPGFDSLVRKPNFETLPESQHLRILKHYTGMLSRHFQPGASFFLYGSAAKGSAKPKDADFCAVIPSLDAASYAQHMRYAAKAKRIGRDTMPLTFSIIPSSHFIPFALSDQDSKFARSGTALSGKEITVPLGDAKWRASITVVAVLHAALRLREALINWAVVSLNPNILKARLSEPYYALGSLTPIFGEPAREINAQKFSPGDVNRFEAVDALIDSNLAMQEILVQYAERMEKE